MMKTHKTKLTLLAVFTMSILTSACNTVEGLGKDIQKGGSTVTEAARDTKEKLQNP